MTTKFQLDPRVLDDYVGDGVPDIEIEAEAAAYFKPENNGGHGYVFHVDTSEYVALWREVSRDFPQSSDWGLLLKKAYEKDPALQEKLSKKNRYGVPQSLLKIPHCRRGSHGELSLHYQKAEIIFMPVSDMERYQWDSNIGEFRKEFLMACETLYVRGEFLEGDAEKFKNCGVTIKP